MSFSNKTLKYPESAYEITRLVLSRNLVHNLYQGLDPFEFNYGVGNYEIGFIKRTIQMNEDPSRMEGCWMGFA